ncbi:MAG: hydantoinase B/oxoprolinase family protein [Thalassobaculaceae bacterium]|nr:hydantoinase B/oxoprolinase family protein [Thalassobaculaceae bacterium]
MSIDPFTLEVIRNGLSAIAEEMSLVVMRSARSPLLREAGDLSSALTDRDGLLIAQGQDIPMHMGVMSFTVQEFLKIVPRDRLRPGDVWLLNLPQVGGNHLPDVKAIRPVFSGDRIVAFAVSLAHWADVGGAAPGSYYAAAYDAWQEGLRIPPLRIITAEGPDEEKLAMVLANVRGPDERRGDILAQVAATRAADRRFAEMFARYGTDEVEQAFAALHDRAERQMRAAIAALPDGVYEGEDFMDDDGHGGPPTAVRVTLSIAGEEAVLDFSASDDAVPGPINTTRFITAASVYYVMKAICGPEIQASAGCYRPLKIVTRPGSILDAPADKPVVGGNHETAQRVADAVFLAFAKFAPEKLSAGGPTTAGLLIFGGHREDGTWTTFYEVHGGGEGARADRDGMPAIRAHMANVMGTPAEVVEAEYPIRVERQEILRGTGGKGKHIGGDGLRRVYRARVDGLTLTTMCERMVIPPYGLEGGEAGAPYRLTLARADGTEVALPGKTNLRIAKGDRVIAESSGGGGYGQI